MLYRKPPVTQNKKEIHIKNQRYKVAFDSAHTKLTYKKLY